MAPVSDSERHSLSSEGEKVAPLSDQNAAADLRGTEAMDREVDVTNGSSPDVEKKATQPDESQYERSRGKIAVIMLALGVCVVNRSDASPLLIDIQMAVFLAALDIVCLISEVNILSC